MTVTGIGARRRVTALFYGGWSPSALAAESGLPEAVFSYRPDDLARSRKGTLEAIGGLYERLWNTAPPRRTEAERATADLFAEHGRQVGWSPALAYDDDLIDLPEGKADPKVWRRTPGERTKREHLLEDIRFLREVDGAYRRATPAELAVRLGKSKDSIEQALARDKRAQRDAAATKDADRELEAG
jgi:hypothetical protein